VSADRHGEICSQHEKVDFLSTRNEHSDDQKRNMIHMRDGNGFKLEEFPIIQKPFITCIPPNFH
jgi:hypothetical protein